METEKLSDEEIRVNRIFNLLHLDYGNLPYTKQAELSKDRDFIRAHLAQIEEALLEYRGKKEPKEAVAEVVNRMKREEEEQTR